MCQIPEHEQGMTKALYRAKLSMKAAQSCAAITNAFLNGNVDGIAWEVAVRETADILSEIATILHMERTKPEPDKLPDS